VSEILSIADNNGGINLSNNMSFAHVNSLKADFLELTYFIRRLEKNGEHDRIPLFREKMKLIANVINSIEDKQNNKNEQP
jgi:hypothetical protein